MKKKLFTLLTLMLCVCGGAWAEEAVLYFAGTSANSITVNGFTLAITGNAEKSWSGGNGNISFGGTNYKTLKNSNGAQNTITCPAGKVATKVVFYVTTNADSSGKLSEIDNTSCSDEVTSIKNYDNPTVITKTINNKSSFTFTFSTKQVCFIAVVTYTDAASDVVANPAISQNGNTVSITCNTTGAKIYYTTDGIEPTTSSNLYSSAITLINPCTILAKAFNGDENQYSSDVVKLDCLFEHSDALSLIGSDTGVMNTDKNVWTGNDGLFTLTNNAEGRTIDNAVGISHGLKINHTDSYTIQPSSDVKVTKIVVVGRTWLSGNASTISFDGFTPESGSFYEADANRNTFIKTLEFIPSENQTYGQVITMRPGTNQLGAYIELYGVKRSGPADPVLSETITHTVTFNADGAVCTNAEIVTMSGGGLKDPTYSGYTKAMEMSSSASITINLPEKATNASVTLFGTNASTTLKLNSTSSTSVSWNGDDTNGYTLVIPIDNSNAGSPYIITKGSGGSRIHKITLTYSIGSENQIKLITTANMAGWRSFYDAEQGYTVDDNTSVYVASALNESSVTLTEIDDIPAATPVILKTTAEDFTMTLTKGEVDAYTGTNMLMVSSEGQDLSSGVYRLGYGDDGVGFYTWTTSSAKAGVVYLEKSAGARSLRMAFAGEGTTGIENITQEAVADYTVYTLGGQRVAQPTKGLYIVNGKKVMVK